MPRGVPTRLRGTAGRAVKAQTPGRGRGEEGRGRGGRGGGGGAARAPPRSAASAGSGAPACGSGHLRQGCCGPPGPPASHPGALRAFPTGRSPRGRGAAGEEEEGCERGRPLPTRAERGRGGSHLPGGGAGACGARWPLLPTSTPATCATSCRRGVSTAPSCNRHRHCRRCRCAAPARLPLGAR